MTSSAKSCWSLTCVVAGMSMNAPPAPAKPEVVIDPDILRIPAGPGEVHVDRYGQGGSRVLLLHGFGTSSFLWRYVGPLLADANCTAYAVDLMGHGESDRPSEVDLGIAAQTEYMERTLHGLRCDSATVVGVDLGGAVAMRLAATFPERVEGLVLVNSLAPGYIPGRDIRRLQRSTVRFAFRISRGVLGAAPLLRTLLEGSVADTDRMPPQLVARYLAPFAGREGAEHLLRLASSVRDGDMDEVELGELSTPTLIVWGAEDDWLDSRVPDRLANAIPAARVERLTGVARLVPEEAPERLAELILDRMRGSGEH